MAETAERRRLRYDARMDPCPACGAWRWEIDGRLWARDRVRCGECNHEVANRDIWSVGRD